MKLSTIKHLIQQTLPVVGMSAYWSVICAPAMFNSSNLDRGTEIRSRVLGDLDS